MSGSSNVSNGLFSHTVWTLLKYFLLILFFLPEMAVQISLCDIGLAILLTYVHYHEPTVNRAFCSHSYLAFPVFLLNISSQNSHLTGSLCPLCTFSGWSFSVVFTCSPQVCNFPSQFDVRSCSMRLPYDFYACTHHKGTLAVIFLLLFLFGSLPLLFQELIF